MILRLSRAIPVAVGAVVAVTALLAPPLAQAAGTGAIKGEISAPGGAPLAEVWACAYLGQDEEFEENCDFTGNDGIYSITTLKAGDYKVEFWPEATEPSYVGEFYDDKPFWEEANEVHVDEGVATTGINAQLAEAATIEGDVDAVSAGGPVDAAVCAQLLTGEFEGCALTRSDGSYTLPALPQGEYRISFTPESFRYNLLGQFYDHKSNPAEADPLALTAGETMVGIDADLEAGAEIHGTVYSAVSGAPISRVRVCALRPAEGEWWLRECVPTSSSGSYALYALGTDSYKVVFSSELKEFFGEEASEQEDDGYFKQYFNDKLTLDAADTLELVAPEIRTGVDGHLQPARTMSLPPALVASSVGARPGSPRKVIRHCRPGFRKKMVRGKRRCVKVRMHKHHKRHRNGRNSSLG